MRDKVLALDRYDPCIYGDTATTDEDARYVLLSDVLSILEPSPLLAREMWRCAGGAGNRPPACGWYGNAADKRSPPIVYCPSCGALAEKVQITPARDTDEKGKNPYA